MSRFTDQQPWLIQTLGQPLTLVSFIIPALIPLLVRSSLMVFLCRESFDVVFIVRLLVCWHKEQMHMMYQLFSLIIKGLSVVLAIRVVLSRGRLSKKLDTSPVRF
jgi:hypothetical protein